MAIPDRSNRRIPLAQGAHAKFIESDLGTGDCFCAVDPPEPLAEAGAEVSVGSGGDAYDNAMAESVTGLFKTEVIRHAGPWRGLDDVEYATLEWASSFNTSRLPEPLGYLPPAEYEAQFQEQCQELQAATTAAGALK